MKKRERRRGEGIYGRDDKSKNKTDFSVRLVTDFSVRLVTDNFNDKSQHYLNRLSAAGTTFLKGKH